MMEDKGTMELFTIGIKSNGHVNFGFKGIVADILERGEITQSEFSEKMGDTLKYIEPIIDRIIEITQPILNEELKKMQ